MSCQRPRARVRAASFGHADRQTACACGGVDEPRSRASNPRISLSRTAFRSVSRLIVTLRASMSNAMSSHLAAQGCSDLPGQSRDGPVLDATGPVDGHVVLRHDATGPVASRTGPSLL